MAAFEQESGNEEPKAVAADLEAARSGASDGAWALATWAPAGFADAVGGF